MMVSKSKLNGQRCFHVNDGMSAGVLCTDSSIPLLMTGKGRLQCLAIDIPDALISCKVGILTWQKVFLLEHWKKTLISAQNSKNEKPMKNNLTSLTYYRIIANTR